MSYHLHMELRNWKGRLLAGSSAVALVVVPLLWPRETRSENALPAATPPAGTHGPYSTHFAQTENPLSEGGKWSNGLKDGLDWTDVRATPGFAFGTEIGGARPAPRKYDDSTALLKGTWGPNQTVQATVHLVNPDQDGKVYEEVELRLRSSLSAHSCTGYEVMFRCSKTPQAY
ncbi:MAG: hypothetical protein ABSC08_12950, partial [Bryobacteraceae bacterium]